MVNRKVLKSRLNAAVVNAPRPIGVARPDGDAVARRSCEELAAELQSIGRWERFTKQFGVDYVNGEFVNRQLKPTISNLASSTTHESSEVVSAELPERT